MFSGWNNTYFGYNGIDIFGDQDYMNYKGAILGQQSQRDKLVSPDYSHYLVKLHCLIDKAIFLYRNPMVRGRKALEDHIEKETY